jgi:beta-lactam-binding protein with PASTA domain
MTKKPPATGSRSDLPGVFISYRRELDAGWAPWLYDKLSEQFGANRIFMDLDSIAAGDDFVEVITRSVASCRVLIALIGKSWTGALDAGGRRRLDDPADFVRLEIETALRHGIRVIPLLIDGATMPAPAELPATLAPITHRQALTLTATHRRYDAEHLVEAVKRALDQPPVEPIPPPSPPPEPSASAPGRLLAAVQPTVARGFRGSSLEVRLTNGGRAQRSVVLRSTASHEGVRITPDRVRVQVPAGETANTRIGVVAAKPLWWGRARDVDVQIRVGVPDAVPATLESRFRQRPFFGLPAMLAILLVFAVTVSVTLESRAATGDVVVPSVLTDEVSARTAMQHAGLQVAVTSVPSDTVPKGKIIRTGPPAGTRVARGSVVTLYVSAGPARSHRPSPPSSATPTKTAPAGCATVPDVTGRSEDAARSAIRDAGFRYHISYRHSGSVEAGKVISTKPGPGSSTCNAVDVYVSRGPLPAACSVSPRSGSSGSTVRMSCEGFAAGEDVTITVDGDNVRTKTADGDGSLSTSVEIPGGFAGADLPGRVFTLRAEGQRSGKHASADFTIEGTSSSTPTTTPSS